MRRTIGETQLPFAERLFANLTFLKLSLPALEFETDKPANRVRLFSAGWNETENGRYLFDDVAAAAILAAYSAHGIDRMLDLEHLSLDPKAPHYDPDARGWFQLAVQNGELWAVNIRWTPDGEARLKERRQRYVSPAFEVDAESRPTKLVNVAITAMPATHNTPALIAASTKRLAMDPAQLPAIAEAMGLGSDATVEDILATIGAMMAKIQAAAVGDGDAEDKAEAPEGQPAADPNAPAADPAMQAARVKLCSLTGRESVGEALADVELWRASYLDLAAERAKITKSQAQLEANERLSLVAQLVSMDKETPATAWVDPTAKVLKPCKRLATEDIGELRARVAKLSGRKPAPKTPAKGEVDAHGLSAAELKICAEQKCEPKMFAMLKAQRDSVKTTGSN